MGRIQTRRIGRRTLLAAGAAALVVPAQAIALQDNPGQERPGTARRNIGSFVLHDWRDHFETLRKGAILSDTTTRVLQFWSEDESVTRIYPTSVPHTDELTKRGYTRIVARSTARHGAPRRR